MRTHKTFYLLLAFALPGLYSCQSSLYEAEEGLPGLALQLAAVGAPDDIVYVGGETRPVRQDLYRVTSLDARRYAELERPGERYEITPVVESGDTLLYVCNYEEGWILLAGDRRSDPVLAGSETGSFSEDGINDGVRVWLSGVKSDMKELKRRPDIRVNKNTELWKEVSPNATYYYRDTTGQTRSEGDYRWVVLVDNVQHTTAHTDTIPHLIQTKWGQLHPWNQKLPVDLLTHSRCYVGCTAVAAAQLLYYTHGKIGKPSGLYHEITVAVDTANTPIQNIGFSRSDYVENSSRWSQMALNKNDNTNNAIYSGDLMIDVGNYIGIWYSDLGSSGVIRKSLFSYYGMTCDSTAYSYPIVLSSLVSQMPVIIRADFLGSANGSGHAWIIDGLHKEQSIWTYNKHCIHTDDWESYTHGEIYEYFGQVRAKYHIDDPSDPIVDIQTTNTYSLLMNWGQNGSYDSGYYSIGSNDLWTAGDTSFQNNKTIFYNFQ